MSPPSGLKVAPARLVGHCVTQVYYDDAWHLYDGDMHSVYLLRDNETIASEQDLVRDHDLIKRTHTQGILRPQGRAGNEWASSIYVFEGKVSGDRSADAVGAATPAAPTPSSWTATRNGTPTTPTSSSPQTKSSGATSPPRSPSERSQGTARPPWERRVPSGRIPPA